MLERYVVQNPKYYSKIMIHMLSFGVVVDIVTLVLVCLYGKSSKLGHTIDVVLSLSIIAIKAGLSVLLLRNYSDENGKKSLLSFEYLTGK